MQVVVTGMGIVSPLGNDLETFWNALISGCSGVTMLDDRYRSQLKCHFAGRVPNLKPETFFTKKQLRRMDRFCQLAAIAAQNAWDDCNPCADKPFQDNTGVIMGTGIGGISTWDHTVTPDPDSNDDIGLNAFTIPRIMNNAAAAQIAMQLHLKGPNITINTACSAGANAIGMAFRQIRSQKAHCIICGGTEAPITPKILKAWDILGVLSKENTKSAVKPFDKNRTGFILSEGAAAIVLESLDSAIRHNKKIYGEIKGFGSNCDAYHLTAPATDGQARAIQLALDDAAIMPEQIDYINAHGTATRANDRVETLAIKNVFGRHAYDIPVSASKSMLGHAMGASSAMEIVATLLSVKNDLIHPTANYHTADPECDLDVVPKKARAKTITHAISNSFGFGGSNAVLVIKKWKN